MVEKLFYIGDIRFVLGGENLNKIETKESITEFLNNGEDHTKGFKLKDFKKNNCVFSIPSDMQARHIVFDIDRTYLNNNFICVKRIDKLKD